MADVRELPPLDQSVPAELGEAGWAALDPHGPAGETFELQASDALSAARLIHERSGRLPQTRALTLSFGRQAALAQLQALGWQCTHLGDAHREPHTRQRPFDAALALGSALNAVGAQAIARTVELMTKQLRPGGLCVYEGPSFYHACRPFRQWDRTPEGLLLREAEFDPVECDQLVRHIHVMHKRMDHAAMRLRVLTCPEAVQLLQAHGLEPLDIRGNWDEDTYTDASPRLIVFARKKQGI